ncbi:MAG TPA: hypothetical protein VL490_10635 [Mucilaginibacter sp.]|jgi:hypothetical protein|nr:hypothetical protein [Mucilaginibacter sp.]
MKSAITPKSNISLITSYKGKQLSLNIIANNDRYSVFENDKTIGHIIPGEKRHTWIVEGSFYVAPQLVNEIAKKIAA